ncbi:MAG: hypothetical protein K0V04_45025, partial [Deltaproteobacteria bacterium]|nr:hypothetical protein [Deltaproteobacteria bacterium]
ATLEEIAKAYNAVTALVRPEHQSFGLVLDSRESAGRNDPEFESLATNLRAQADASFARVVVLVATAVGELQVRRMAKSARHDALVTRDETEAMQLARG